ncbi:MAG: phytanoyl-CoA dioxygenase family protein [Opitutaceae bacterium]
MNTASSTCVDTDAAADALAALKRDGYCVMKGVIPADEVAAVRDSIEKTVRKHTMLPLPKGFVTGLLRLDQSIAPYLAEPRLMTVVDRLFGDNARVSMLSGALNGPGIKRGDVHADWPFNQNSNARIRAPYPDVLVNLVTMWMLTDYTVENGGTIVIPGSHKRDYAPKHGTRYDPKATYEGEVQLVGKAGDVGLFDARTWHAIAPSTASTPRVGVIVRYAPWWLNLQTLHPGTRDHQQIVAASHGDDSTVELVPLSIYKNLPEDVKPLVYHMVDENS